jgi:hypothetical protein
MTATLWTLVLLLPAAPAPTLKIEPPKGPAPRVVTIESEAAGKLTLRDTVQQMVPTTRVVPVTQTVNVKVGQEIKQVQQTVQRQVTVMVPVPRIVNRTLDLEKVPFYGVDGKKIDDKDVKKMLVRPVAALVSADGKPVDRFYLQLARPGTLVLVLPPAEAGMPGEALIPPGPPPVILPAPVPKEKK